MKNYPSQLIPDSKKDVKWCEQMLDAIVNHTDHVSSPEATEPETFNKFKRASTKFEKDD